MWHTWHMMMDPSYICDIYVTYMWHICDVYVTYMWHICDVYVTYVTYDDGSIIRWSITYSSVISWSILHCPIFWSRESILCWSILCWCVDLSHIDPSYLDLFRIAPYSDNENRSACHSTTNQNTFYQNLRQCRNRLRCDATLPLPLDLDLGILEIILDQDIICVCDIIKISYVSVILDIILESRYVSWSILHCFLPPIQILLFRYGVASISGLLKITGLFCRIQSLV